MIQHTHWKGWLLYACAASLLQLTILGVPWDWFLLVIFPSMIVGTYLGFIFTLKIDESLVFISGTLLQFFLLILTNWLAFIWYNVNYSSLFQLLFSLPAIEENTLLTLLLYLASLIQFFVIWILYRWVLSSQVNVHFQRSSKRLIVVLLGCLIFYLVFYVGLALPFLWLIGPLVMISFVYLGQHWMDISLWVKGILFSILLLSPLLHALIATYISKWAFPLSLLILPLSTLFVALVSRSPSQRKIG